MGKSPGKSYGPLPSSMFFDLLACPVHMLLLTLGLYITYIVHADSHVHSRGQVSDTMLSHCQFPLAQPYCSAGPPQAHAPPLHYFTTSPYQIASWVLPDSAQAHSNPFPLSHFAFPPT